MALRLLVLVTTVFLAVAVPLAQAQAPGGGPPAVGVVKVTQTAITQSSEFIGRIQAIGRVSLTARVTAFLEQQLFDEGSEVHEGDLLYRLERGPFEAAMRQQEATVADAAAKQDNARIHLQRAEQLLRTPAGQRSNVEDAQAAQRSAAAQLLAAQAALQQAQINLNYTEIKAPISGKISRTAITVGNVVSPGSGPLATIVSQDPMYVVFPVAAQAQAELEKRYAEKGGMSAVVVRLKLPDGSLYDQKGHVDYVDPTVSSTTDTIVMRAQIPNPPRFPPQPGQPVDRPLIDGAFTTVLVEGIQPVMALAIPRAAVLSDQQGNYVFVVGTDDKVEQRRIQLGQSTPTTAVVSGGLKEGETVIVDGLQRAKPGVQVTPGPASPSPAPPTPGTAG
jgi:membrane fusion protein, multidrug efflux system